MDILTTEEVLRAEANAIHGEDAIAGDLHGSALYRALGALDSAALCLSGGGIRSAAFALGVIQALASHPRSASGARVRCSDDSLLGKFHYLSTVSGGGYIGGWLSAGVARTGFGSLWPKLLDVRARPEEEPGEIAWLRRYSNYLTPKLGIGSADAWTVVAIFIRNLVLNWLVLLPVLCGALLLLKLVAVGVAWLGKYPPDDCTPGVPLVLAAIGLVLLVAAVHFATRRRPSRTRQGATQPEFLIGDLLPAGLSGLMFTLALAVPCAHHYALPLPLFSWSGGSLVSFGVAAGVAAYGLGWLLALPRSRGRANFGLDFLAWTAAGAVYGALLGLGVYVHRLIYGAGFWEFDTSEVALLVFGVPWALTIQLVAETIFVALSSWEVESDADREWFGRAAGWFVVSALGWTIVMFLSLVAAQAIVHLYAQISDNIYAKLATALPGLLSAVATAVLGKSSLSPARGPAKNWTGLMMDIGLAIAAPVFAASLVILASALLDAALLGQPLLETTSIHGPPAAGSLPPWPDAATLLLEGLAVAATVGVIASKFVNINQFSLHALYRNRLIRAFLGAAHPHRRPDPFTGFDEADNLSVYQLWSPGGGWQPFHLVNMTLNIVSTTNLAWQERKAESFTVSPLHAGSGCRAFRLSRDYGRRDRGISLGTALAISGAAVSPNMGYHSSPAVTLLLALLNVRLGWWLGNPGPEGEKTYRDQGPKTAVAPLLEEAFGLTTDKKPYVYLSDGGHFENLGLYEMVRRRCRFIVVSDAGCDPDFAFADLGNAVRKIKLDLGVAIRFRGLTALVKRQNGGAGARTPYHAIGEIDYPDADGTEGVRKGLILYIKPAYHGSENIDIRSYAAANPDFPHQSTTDQWFSESQFESYRALGFEITDKVLQTALARLQYPAMTTLDQIFGAIATATTERERPGRRRRGAMREAAEDTAA